jgi:hypothetical protein
MSSTVSATTALNSIPAQPNPAANPQQRLVPATVGNQTVYLPCFGWCAVDHADEPVNHLKDILHFSGDEPVRVLTLLNNDTAHSELSSAVSCDPSASDPRLRAAHLAVAVGATSEDAYLTPDMACALADDLDMFAQQLRTQAAVARLHNAAADDACPICCYWTCRCGKAQVTS